MKLLTVDTIEEARQKLLGSVTHGNTRRWISSEPIETGLALGRVLATDISSPEDVPGFRRSAVDGYAVISADTVGAGEALPVLLRQIGMVEMGKPAGIVLTHGECAYVPTGAMIPEGADSMVMVEHTEPFDGEIAIYQSTAAGNHVVRIGEDLERGDILLPRGRKLGSSEIGALAAVGITNVPAYIPPSISIISSGDELVSPPTLPGPGEVRDINTTALVALATESHYRVVGIQSVKDEEEALADAVRRAMTTSEVVVLSGGSSQGAKDMTECVFAKIAGPGVFTHGLAIKPGKPTILGYDEKSDTLLVGLPGHPVSALVVFRILLSWLIKQLTGLKDPHYIPAKIACNLAGSPGRTCCQPVALVPDGVGYIAEPVFGKSGMISTLTKSDGYIVIDMNKEGVEKGEAVQVFPWEF